MLSKTVISASILVLILGCSKEEPVGGHPMQWLYGISKEQKNLHDEFKSIIDDTGLYGMLDSFLVDTIYCYETPSGSCPEFTIDYFGNSLTVNSGDLFELKEGRIRVVDKPFAGQNYQDFGLNHGAPKDFKYIEFGIMKDGVMKTCCGYSTVVSLDLDQKIIEFTFPYPHFQYIIRLKGID